MKTHIVFGGILASLFAGLATAAGSSCSNFLGEWKNNNALGSTLSISNVNQNTGALAGTYQSPSGTSGQKFALTGWTNSAAAQSGEDNASVIAFSVQWGSYGSITSWTGSRKVEQGVPTIRTLWHLARPHSQFSWDHIITNNDVFTPK
jgi:hypothetical protein